ncbi:MATE family efflux transporter [Labrys monachus]|uniref:Multidrug-efflux transporter n=1 Tax=Labrys monachus TaxID=217067 RepID=A0ABU0FB33_9HYPH|nr:MATE family efflux transporter [Labrys monachus]MDQ0391761.1 MATE family multidrug resistance protein [Labrys monachus]
MANTTSATGHRNAWLHGGSWRSEAWATCVLALPLILTNLVELALTTTNLILVGELGASTLAAVTLANNLFFFFAMIGLGVVTAVAPMVARQLGARADATDDVRRTVQQGLWAAALVSLPGLACLAEAETIFRLLGQTPAIAAEAGRYMAGLCWALPPFVGYIALRSAATAMGRPRSALWAALAAILVNAVMAWALLFGRLGLPALGPQGAGIGTAIATWSLFLLLAASLAFARPFRRFRLFHRFGRPDVERLMQVFRLGVPIAVTLIFEVAVFNAAGILMGLVGEVDLAAHGIAMQIASISFMVPLGLGQAAMVRVGRAYGARDARAITRAGWTAYALGVGSMAVTALLMLLAPRLLIGNFIDLNDPANAEVVARAALFLVFAGLFQIADGAQVVAAGMLRGLHDTRAPMLLAAIGYWLAGLPLGALLAFHYGFGGSGIWMGLVAGLLVVAVLLTGRWMRRDRLAPAA